MVIKVMTSKTPSCEHKFLKKLQFKKKAFLIISKIINIFREEKTCTLVIGEQFKQKYSL